VTELEQGGPSANEVREVLNYVLTQLNKSSSTHVEKKVANG
jgi:chromosome partitioning protein